jgi:flagellar assembly protein FliH
MAAGFPFTRAFDMDERRMAPLEKREATLTVSEHQRLIAMAAASADAAGHARGVAETEAAATHRLGLAMQSVSGELAALRFRLEDIEAAAADEAVRFAALFAARLAGALVERHPAALIAETARIVLADLRGAPHAAIRVAPDLVENARSLLQAVARDAGLETRLVVIGEPEIPPGDVRIEWADGGIVRDRAATESAIAAGVARILQT